ncbi:embryonic polyadenylate-binding protein 2 isoform 2-T2 [Mantella aurantiaca]
MIQAGLSYSRVWADHGRLSSYVDVTWDMSETIAKQEPEPSKGDHGDECDLDDPELMAIKIRVREMEEETERLKGLTTDETPANSPVIGKRDQSFPHTRRRAGGAHVRQIPRARLAGHHWQIPFHPSFFERNLPFYEQSKDDPRSMTAEEKREVDARSIYVGNVDYGGTAQDLESHFSICGCINRITILCDRFSGHPKGYAYIEFEEQRSAEAAIELDDSVFRGRSIKVLPKRTNVPGISTTDRGIFRGRSRGPRENFSRGNVPRGNIPRGNIPRANIPRGNVPRGQRFRGRASRGRGRPGRWNNSY